MCILYTFQCHQVVFNDFACYKPLFLLWSLQPAMFDCERASEVGILGGVFLRFEVAKKYHGKTTGMCYDRIEVQYITVSARDPLLIG